eukprot:5942924-Prymnesium_polylepis.1
MEREILNAIDAIEDDDAQVSKFMDPGEGPLEVHVKASQAAAGAKAVLQDHRTHAQFVALQRQAAAVQSQEKMAAMQVGVRNTAAK